MGLYSKLSIVNLIEKVAAFLEHVKNSNEGEPVERRITGSNLGRYEYIKPASLTLECETIEELQTAYKQCMFQLNKFSPSHTHVKTNGEYEIVDTINLQASKPITSDTQVVIYLDKSGNMWAREINEFFDGRFKEISG